MCARFFLSLAVVALLSLPAWPQSRKEALIVFKDGFYLTGKVVEKRDYIMDPSGQSFTIPLSGGLINLDDRVRRIYFIPGQLQAVEDKKEVDRDLLDLRRFANTSHPDKILPGWQVETFTPFNAKWERTLKVRVPDRGSFNMDQRIVQATPYFLHIQTLKYNWDLYHLTKEFAPAEIRELLTNYYADKKDMKDWDKRKIMAMFMHQAGWHEEAQKELNNLADEYASKKDEVAGLQETIKKTLANIYVEDTEQISKSGQHPRAQERLAQYAKENMAPLVTEKNLLMAQDLKNKYESLNEKIAQAKVLFNSLLPLIASAERPFWTKISNLIMEELNHDTLSRIDTFFVFAQQHLREVEDKSKPSQTTEEVLSLAVSGWLVGNSSAEADVQNTRLLMQAREMVLQYQKTENTVLRNQMLSAVFQSGKLTLDVLARVIKNLPPPFPLDLGKIGSTPLKLGIELADSRGGNYYVQLPPDYNHQRSYPVLLLLHGAREKPDVMMARFKELADLHGFILVAPLWGGSSYTYTDREHALVLDTLRDVRRRLQVDSDRVFLFGWEQGGDAAIDIGLSHPDQFAGVLPMCGSPRYFTFDQNRYQTNAQYLPFYLVEGDRNGANPKAICSVFKTWVSGVYPALYVEYKGRGSEWYQAELPRMFDWMTRKKRHHPMREMGRRHTGGGVGEEFRTMRECDNRFYWLSTDAIDPRFLNSADRWVRSIPPATMVASISVGNEMVAKPGGKSEAKIFTQFNIQTKGLKQLTLWLAPNMVDFTKPIRIRVNNSQVGNDRVIPPNPAVLMEDFFYNGDRQRLYFAKVDLKF